MLPRREMTIGNIESPSGSRQWKGASVGGAMSREKSPEYGQDGRTRGAVSPGQTSLPEIPAVRKAEGCLLLPSFGVEGRSWTLPVSPGARYCGMRYHSIQGGVRPARFAGIPRGPPLRDQACVLHGHNPPAKFLGCLRARRGEPCAFSSRPIPSWAPGIVGFPLGRRSPSRYPPADAGAGGPLSASGFVGGRSVRDTRLPISSQGGRLP